MTEKRRPTEKQMDVWYYRRWQKFFEIDKKLIPATAMSQRKLKKLWKFLTERPFPDVEGYLLSDKNFEIIHDSFPPETATEYKHQIISDFKERGKPIETKRCVAFEAHMRDKPIIVCRRKHYSNTTILHELKHILDEIKTSS